MIGQTQHLKTGIISNFTAGDLIELQGFNMASHHRIGQTLSLTNKHGGVDSLTFAAGMKFSDLTFTQSGHNLFIGHK